MDEIDDATLLRYNLQALIPGPDETIEAFLKRTEYCLTLKENFAERVGGDFPLEHVKEPEGLWNETWQITEPVYGIKPSWIPLFFSNYRLNFWHGGCAWIFQQSEDTPTSAFFQLRRALRNATSYLGLYKRKELMAHELCHVGRMLFEEPQFEEILAYRSSLSPFRRWLGPIVQAPWESALFVLLLFFILLLDFTVLTVQPNLFFTVAWAKLLPLGLLLYAFVRLYRTQKTFQNCLNNLTQALGDPLKANAVAYRLTDSEIRAFASLQPIEINAYAKQQGSLRWKVINKAYFF